MTRLSEIDFGALRSLGNSAAPRFETIRLPNPAEAAVNAIWKEISSFEASLDANHEVGMTIVGGPVGLCLHVREVYRSGTDKLIFTGLDSNANPVRLVQHVSQLNFLMLAVSRLGEIAARVGFHEPESAPAPTAG